MRNMAYGVTIKSLDLIEGKDRIVYAHFNENGYGVIVDKSFKVGEAVVYFEVDSILPVKKEFEFLRKRCYKEKLNGFLIKNMKMNGLYSNGLVLHAEEAGLKKAKAGEDYTEKLDVKKYEPEDDASPVENKMPSWKKFLKNMLMKHEATRWLGRRIFFNKKSGEFPTWLIDKSDEENIQNHTGWYDKYKNDDCYISVKMEGQSVTMLLNPKTKKLEVYSRNTAGNDSHFAFAKENDIEKKLKKILKDTGDVYAFQGEYCSPLVQKGIYKNGIHWYIYTVKNLTLNKVVSYSDMLYLCNKYGFETVPIWDANVKLCNEFKDMEDLQEKTEHIWFKPGTEDMSSCSFFDDRVMRGSYSKPEYHRSEGFVIRSIDESWSFKVKSNNYQIEGL